MNGNPMRGGSKTSRSNNARFACVIGGSCLASLSQKEDLRAEIVAVVDVVEEIEQLGLSGKEIVAIPIAEGETLATLIEKGGSPELKSFSAKRPGADLNLGMGQTPAVGDLAAKLLVANERFHSRINAEVYAPLLRSFDGNVRSFQIDIFSGMAGATGAGAGIPIGEATAATFLNQSSGPVTIRHIRIGSLSYEGCGDRVHRNGAATLSQTVEFVLDPKRHPSEIRAAEFVEFPMVGADKRKRDQCMREFGRAIQSPKVQETLRRGFPNECLESPYGAIRLITVGFHNPIGPHQLAADVARACLPEGQRLLQVGARAGIGEEITVGLREEPLELPSPQMIAESVKRAKVIPPGLESHCIASPTRFEVEKIQVGISGQEPTSLPVLLTTSCRTRDELAQKLELLMGLSFQLDRHLKEKTRLMLRATADAQTAKLDVFAFFGRLYPKSLLQQWTSPFTDRAGEIIRFQNSILTVRHRLETVDRLTAEVKALGDAAAQIASEIEREQERVRRVCGLLAAVADSASPQPVVHAGNIDHFFGPLLEQVTNDSGGVSDEMLQTLSQGAEHVTLAGLGQIFGIPDARPEQIAHAIVHGVPVTAGPPWGGRRTSAKGRRIMHLPAMRKDLEEAICRAVGQIDPDLIVATADSAKGSINAVLLEIYCPRTADDIFTPFHIQHLRKACEMPELYFPAGKTGAHWLPENRNERSEPCDA